MAVLNPRPVSVGEEMLAYYTSDKPARRMWFSRKLNAMTDEQKEAVYQYLEARGHKPRGKTALTQETLEGIEEEEPQQEEAAAVPQETAEQERERKSQVRWTEDEIDKLARLVWLARKNAPDENIIALVTKVMSHLPEDRRRRITATEQCSQITEKLTEHDERIKAKLEKLEFLELEMEELKDKVKEANPDAVREAMTDEDVLKHFKDRVLTLLTAEEVLSRYTPESLLQFIPTDTALTHLVGLGISTFLASQQQIADRLGEVVSTIHKMRPVNGQHSVPEPHTMRGPDLPRVTVVGLLANQHAAISRALFGRAKLNFVDKNLKPNELPQKMDVLVVAANFVKHAHTIAARKRVEGTNTKYIEHHGGIDKMIRAIKDFLPPVVDKDEIVKNLQAGVKP